MACESELQNVSESDTDVKKRFYVKKYVISALIDDRISTSIFRYHQSGNIDYKNIDLKRQYHRYRYLIAGLFLIPLEYTCWIVVYRIPVFFLSLDDTITMILTRSASRWCGLLPYYIIAVRRLNFSRYYKIEPSLAKFPIFFGFYHFIYRDFGWLTRTEFAYRAPATRHTDERSISS